MNAIPEGKPHRSFPQLTALDVRTAGSSKTSRHHSHHSILPGLIKVYDVSSAFAAAVVVSAVAYERFGLRDSRFVLTGGLLAACAFLLQLSWKTPYDLHHLADRRRRPQVLVLPLLSGALAEGLAMLLLPSSQSLLFVTASAAAWLLLTLTLLVGGHAVLGQVLRRPSFAGHLTGRIAIVGAGHAAQRIAQRLSSASVVNVVGFFDVTPRDRSSTYMLHGEAVDTVSSGGIDELIDITRTERVSGIIIALSPDQEHEVAGICLRLRSVLADIYVAPNLLHGHDFEVPLATIGPLTLAVVQRRPLTQWERLQKSIFDRVVGIILLTLLLPGLLVIACLIKMESKGPVLFKQPRLGLNNRSFTVFKFRSMYASMADILADRQTSRDDPRVTRVGKWLRKLSLDELPQLLNVLRGEMSIVGPRPHAPNTRAGGKLLDDALAEYVIRHQVKPGITGWAQVNGARGELQDVDQLRRRVTFDLEYMQRWSLAFDIRIMLLTILREVVSPHAF